MPSKSRDPQVIYPSNSDAKISTDLLRMMVGDGDEKALLRRNVERIRGLCAFILSRPEGESAEALRAFDESDASSGFDIAARLAALNRELQPEEPPITKASAWFLFQLTDSRFFELLPENMIESLGKHAGRFLFYQDCYVEVSEDTMKKYVREIEAFQPPDAHNH